MTSLSNVFRSYNTVTQVGETRQIGIRNLNFMQEQDSEQELSLEAVFAERDRILNDAYALIDQEKLAIENMRVTATEDVASMQSAWEEEKAKLQQQAYDEGFPVGFEEGRAKAISEMMSSIQLANEAAELSSENAYNYLVSQERVILELAMRTAEKILGQTLEEDDGKFLSVVKRALKEVREMKDIRLYVSIEFFELISDNRAELASIFPPDVAFLIFANEDFESTECFIETNHGRIVVSIDEQLNELRERLIEIMESGD